MENFDPVAREFECIERPGVARLHRRVDFLRGNAQAGGVEVKAVELSRRLDQRHIAPFGHVVDNGAGRALDIGRYLALRREETCEAFGEIGATAIETNRHIWLSGGRILMEDPTAQWRGDKSPSTL